MACSIRSPPPPHTHTKKGLIGYAYRHFFYYSKRLFAVNLLMNHCHEGYLLSLHFIYTKQSVVMYSLMFSYERI